MFQGSTFNVNVTWKNANGTNKNLSGVNARMQIRSSYSSNVIVESLTTSNGEIITDTATSSLRLVLPASRTANISVNRNLSSIPPRTKYVYDLEVVELDGFVTKIIYGELTVFGEVTR
jgi:hypothetical protein